MEDGAALLDAVHLAGEMLVILSDVKRSSNELKLFFFYSLMDWTRVLQLDSSFPLLEIGRAHV